MSFNQVIAILRARWVILVAIIGLAVVVSSAVSFLQPKQYTSTSSVVVDVKSPDPVVGMVLPGMMTPGYMATQIDLIQSERVARRVIDSLHLADAPILRAQWQSVTKGRGDIKVWIAETLGKNLKIEPSRESNVISISYTATDPTFAMAMVNAYVDAYIAATADLRVEPAKQYSTLFESLATQLRTRLEKAQDRLSEYQKSAGLMATDERLDVETARLNDLSAQVVTLQAMSVDAAGRRKEASSGDRGDKSTEVLNNPSVAALKADLARQEVKLDELSARFGDAHPQVLEVKENIRSARGKLAAEINRVRGSLGINADVMLDRVNSAKAELEKQREKLLKLKEQRNNAAVLSRDVENLQKAYDAVQARLNQSNIEAQATQTNLAVLKYGSVPLSPSSPRIFLNVAVALFVGILVAVGTALSVELLDRRVRTNADIVEVLNLPIIGVMLKTDNLQVGFLRRRNPLWSIAHSSSRSITVT